MIDLRDCIKIGKIAKSYSTKGQVILRLQQKQFKEINKMESVFIEIDGLPVPFFISDYTHRNDDEIILTIDDIDSEEKTRQLQNNVVWINTRFLKDSVPDSTGYELVPGYEIFDVNLGFIGILDSILEFDRNPLLRIIHEKKEILIPFVTEFIKEVDDNAKKIIVITPKGLVDLF